eukprot:gene18002-33834_t
MLPLALHAITCASLPQGLRGSYQLQDSTMTLAEGLAEYYTVNPGLSDPSQMKDKESARYFRNHDTTHVIFGTHTNFINEGVNDLWTEFGVDISGDDYFMGFFNSQSGVEITFHYLSQWHALPAMLYYPFQLLPTIKSHATDMTKLWPWDVPPAMYDQPIGELRKEFNIIVINPDEKLKHVDFSAKMFGITLLFALAFLSMFSACFCCCCCCCHPCRKSSSGVMSELKRD